MPSSDALLVEIKRLREELAELAQFLKVTAAVSRSTDKFLTGALVGQTVSVTAASASQSSLGSEQQALDSLRPDPPSDFGGLSC